MKRSTWVVLLLPAAGVSLRADTQRHDSDRGAVLAIVPRCRDGGGG